MTTTVEKVTVSLPNELVARIEGLRHSGGLTRSEVISDLLWRGWRQLEDESREDRYRTAYQAQPETDEEFAWADMAADELSAGDPRMDVGEPNTITQTSPGGIRDTVDGATRPAKKSIKAVTRSPKVAPERRAAR